MTSYATPAQIARGRELLAMVNDPDWVPPALHFVGFRGEEYWSAVRVWGRPAFIHMGNDPRMRRELHPGDTVVFANGAEAQPAERNYPDTKEVLPQ